MDRPGLAPDRSAPPWHNHRVSESSPRRRRQTGGSGHVRHAGNRADVWKHVILTRVVFHLAERVGSKAFRYLETHCGGPAYQLPPRGAWREGIGKLTAKRHDDELSGFWYGQPLAVPRGPGSARIHAGDLYLGSWMQVAMRLRHGGVRYQLRLCDTSDEVAAQIRPMGIDFVHGDGFAELARDPQRYHLIFIDPNYGDDQSDDWERVREAVGQLGRAKAHYLVWYPVYSQLTVRRVQELVDGTSSHTVEIRWDELGDQPGRTMNGCGMLLGEEIHKVIAVPSGWDRLATELGGRYVQR